MGGARPALTQPALTQPECGEIEHDRVEGRDPDLLGICVRREQSIGTPVQRQDLEGARPGVHEPHVRHTFAQVHGHLGAAIVALRARRENLANSIGAQDEEGCIRHDGHRFATPSAEIRHQNVGVGPQVKLGLAWPRVEM